MFAIGETSTVYTFKGPVCKVRLTDIQIASSDRLSLKLTTLDLKSRHLSSSSGCDWYPQWCTVDICLCLNVSPVQSFNLVLPLLCVYLLFLWLQAYSCSIDGTVRLWDFTDGILIKVQLLPVDWFDVSLYSRQLLGRQWRNDCAHPVLCVLQREVLLFSFRPTSSDSLFTAFTRQSTMWASFSSSFPLQGTKDQVGSPSTCHHL